MTLSNQIVVAGAGAGKTYALVQAYLCTLLGENPQRKVLSPNNLLALTFTDKAAAEMRERIVSQLQSGINEGVVDRLGALDLTLPDDAVLQRLRRSLPFAPISTFHSFCANLIREHANVLGVDHQFELLSEHEEYALLKHLAELEVLAALDEDDPHAQELAARFQLKKFGGANGLIDFLVQIHQQVVESGVHIEKVSLVSPKNSENEIPQLLDNVQRALLEMESSPKLTPKAKERLLEVRSALKLVYPTLERFKSKEGEVHLSFAFKRLRMAISGRFGADEQRRALVLSVNELGSALCDAVVKFQAGWVRDILSRLVQSAKEYKKAHRVLAFGDLLVFARQLLMEHPQIRKSYKKRFQGILVDEFQDTSPIQEDLIALLCEEESVESEHANSAMRSVKLQEGKLFIVGDPKQSIYGFRGAEVRLFYRTLESVVTQGGEKKSLDTCRRSQAAIVELVNLVATQNFVGQKDVELSALREGLEKAGEIWQVEDESLGVAKAIQARLLKDESLQAKDIAILVRRIQKGRPIVRALQNLGIPAQIFGGDGFFAREEIVDLVSALRLMINPNDDLATLTILRSHLTASPDSAWIPTLQAVYNWKAGFNWSMIMGALKKAQVPSEVKERLFKFDAILKSCRERLYDVSLAELLDEIIEGTLYDVSMQLQRVGEEEEEEGKGEIPLAPFLKGGNDEGHLIRGGSDGSDEKLANVRKLRAMCLANTIDPYAYISHLWQCLSDPPKTPEADLGDSADYVRVMTVHQSKGLEFKAVVLADMASNEPNESDDILYDADLGLAVSYKGRPISVCAPESSDARMAAPTLIDQIRQHKKARSEEEMARLLYVAMTRARDELYFVEVVDEEGKAKERGVSLRSLFYRGKLKDAKRFEELMPQTRIDLTVEQVTKARQASGFQPWKGCPKALGGFKKRVKPSSFDAKGESTEKLLKGGEKQRELGVLGHKLLARVGEYLIPNKNRTQQELKAWLKQAVRLEALDPESEDIIELINRCAQTLNGPIKELVDQGARLSFEEFLSAEVISEDGETQVLEGIADLIARGEFGTLVVDFKSCEKTAQSESTRMQLECYAKCLAAKDKDSLTPVFIAPCVIGQSESLVWTHII